MGEREREREWERGRERGSGREERTPSRLCLFKPWKTGHLNRNAQTDNNSLPHAVQVCTIATTRVTRSDLLCMGLGSVGRGRVLIQDRWTSHNIFLEVCCSSFNSLFPAASSLPRDMHVVHTHCFPLSIRLFQRTSLE